MRTRPDRSTFNVNPVARGRGTTPAVQIHSFAADALACNHDTVCVNLIDAMPEPHLDSQFLKPLFSLRPKGSSEPHIAAETRGAISTTSTIRADAGSIRRNSDFIEPRTSTAMAPAISTPVGPAPTRIECHQIPMPTWIFFGLR